MKTVSHFPVILVAFIAIKCVTSDEESHEKFLKSTRDFAVDFLKIACQDDENNAIMSPTSVSGMLALVQHGARGNTQEQLSQVLALDPYLAKTGYRNLTKAFTEETRGVTVEWGNRAYTKPGLSIRSEFKQETQANFGTEFQEIDFLAEPSQVIADLINKWMSDSTHGQIKDTIEPHMINSDTIMMLVNVIYFKGSWRNRFREKNTKMEKFEKSASESVSTSFMYQKNKFYTGRNFTLGVKWIELPFQGDTHKMVFVLPLKRHTLNKVMTRLKGDDLKNMISYGDLTEVRLRLPKFNIKTKFSLVQLLTRMGVKDLFTASCNLSGISPEPLHVSDAFHQATIEIDEKGSTASAATVVTLSRKLILSETFRLDHPFLFFVIDSHSNVPLFAGKITDPTAS